jgi:hypothetical protein
VVAQMCEKVARRARCLLAEPKAHLGAQTATMRDDKESSITGGVSL